MSQKIDYQQIKKNQVKTAMEQLVTIFQEENIPFTIAQSYLEKLNIPSDTWSLNNRMIMKYVARTKDARTFNDWKKVGRNVKKGEKAFYILAPAQYKYTVVDKETKEEIQKIGMFFVATPRFGLEQTEGKPIKIVVEPVELPPLAEVAQKLGITISYDRTQDGEFGWTIPRLNKIVLCTDDIPTYFHELVHNVQYRIEGKLKGGQDKEQEIIAEFSAAVLARIYGIETKKSQASAFSYIKAYCGKTATKEQVGKEIVRVMGKVEKILDFIFNVQNNKNNNKESV